MESNFPVVLIHPFIDGTAVEKCCTFVAKQIGFLGFYLAVDSTSR